MWEQQHPYSPQENTVKIKASVALSVNLCTLYIIHLDMCQNQYYFTAEINTEIMILLILMLFLKSQPLSISSIIPDRKNTYCLHFLQQKTSMQFLLTVLKGDALAVWL